jgi:hypothetical protein
VKVLLSVFFFMGRALFIMSLFHVVRESMDSFTWRSWSVWGRQSEGRGLRGGETRPGCCTMTTHLLTCCSSSVNFWRSTRLLSSPNRPILQIWPLQTFFFVPEVEIHSEGLRFRTLSHKTCSRTGKTVRSGV